ncbi:MAG: HTTM domain-containing protein [Myxococcales bacterium]|nr:HTTM domain-containing protein [Myxococcales bacterium]
MAEGRVGAALRRTFFEPAPVAAVLRFRRLLALWTAVYVGVRLPHLGELYCQGILNDGVLYRHVDVGPPSEGVVIVVVVALGIALALVVVGRRVRAATLAAFVLFGLLVGIEAAVPRAYAELALIQWGLLVFAPGPPARLEGGAERVEAPWASRLVVLQLASVYVFAGLAKLVGGAGWWSGEAVLHVLRSPHYGDHLLSSWWALGPGGAAAIAWATMLGELGIGVGLVFARTRRWAALGLVVLHVAIALSMRVSLLFHALVFAHLVLLVGPRGVTKMSQGTGS